MCPNHTTSPLSYVCERCGKAFSITRRDRTPRFCSRACYRAGSLGKRAKTAEETRNCAHCGRPFTYRPWELKRRTPTYCSPKCYHATHARVERVCEQCGNTFSVPPSKLAYGPVRFCSQACYHIKAPEAFEDQVESPPKFTPRLLLRPHENSRYQTREDFFDAIDTEEKAYWLGFLAADGSVHKNYVQLSLAMRDGAHVELLRDTLSPDRPVYIRKNAVRLQIGSARLVRRLAELGIGERKSFTIEPWNGPTELMRHYWRGAFDGDGGISKCGTHWTVNFVGSQAMVEGFAEFVRSTLGCTGILRPMGHIWEFRLSGRPTPRKAAELLYHDSHISLARKRIRVTELLSTPELRYWAHQLQRARQTTPI